MRCTAVQYNNPFLFCFCFLFCFNFFCFPVSFPRFRLSYFEGRFRAQEDAAQIQVDHVVKLLLFHGHDLRRVRVCVCARAHVSHEGV